MFQILSVILNFTPSEIASVFEKKKKWKNALSELPSSSPHASDKKASLPLTSPSKRQTKK